MKNTLDKMQMNQKKKGLKMENKFKDYAANHNNPKWENMIKRDTNFANSIVSFSLSFFFIVVEYIYNIKFIIFYHCHHF